MIPWTISQQYQDPEFPSLSGARVVRIAAHPDMHRAGYGSRALELLRRYYEGDLADLVRLPVSACPVIPSIVMDMQCKNLQHAERLCFALQPPDLPGDTSLSAGSGRVWVSKSVLAAGITLS